MWQYTGVWCETGGLCDSIQVYVYEVGGQHYCVTVIL